MNFKTILACAALGLVLFNGRLNAAVESDIVGYQTIAMEAGKWYQVGCPFVALDNATTKSINEVFTTGFADGDVLSILNPTTLAYTAYYWKSSANGWCTKRGTSLVNATINVGQAVFINKNVTSDVSLMGKVDVSQATEFGTPEGDAWSQIVCVYPQDTKLNAMKWTGIAEGDVASILDNSTTEPTYVAYYWKESANGWCTKRGKTPVDVVVPAGQALFIHKISAGVGTVSAN